MKSSPEKNKKIIKLDTEQPDVSVRSITHDDLSEVQDFFDRNEERFAKGGLIASALFDKVLNNLASTDTQNLRMGIFDHDKLVGYVGVTDYDDKGRREVSYGIDGAAARKGMALAALNAVTKYENDNGHDVIAEVEHSNVASMKLLEKANFVPSRKRSEDGRAVYEKLSMDEKSLMQHLRELGMY